MPTRRIVLSAATAGLAGCTMPPSLSARPAAGRSRSPTLVAYADDVELTQALDRWRSRTQALDGGARRLRQGSFAQDSMSLALPAAPAPAALAEKSAAPGAAADASITNVQTAGVDEGGIVKHAGNHLVILRRGRLFTVRIGGGALAPVATIDAYGPGIDPAGAWYDELLVSGSTIVVVGYSYARGGTEIGLFDLRPDGGLVHRATWHLRSNDYYASRNYASRLVGSMLVFYSPMVLTAWGAGPWAPSLPGLRRWQGAATPPEFERILPATRIFRTDDEFEPGEPLALHTVTACDLSAPRMTCRSTAVLGPPGRVFYMAQGSVYVWTHAPARRVRPQRDGTTTAAPPVVAERSAVFRIPLATDAAPTAIKTAGVPIDQMSFLEDDGHLAVLLREAGPGEGMWGAERSDGGTALLRVPLAAFGDGKDAAGPQHYRRLPATGGVAHNRFVGDWLLWGGGDRRLYTVRHAGTGDAQAIDAGHGIERIEAMGRDAVAVGNDGADLVVTAVRLAGDAPRATGRHVQPGVAQGETRTHGFFYRPTGEGEGLLGLPVLGAGGRRASGIYAGGGAASVLFLRQRRLDFTALGALAAQPAPGPRDDGCKASCVDWYGNARPIFLDGRVFALLGYELVEGDLVGEGGGRERIVERRRVGFAPQAGRLRNGRYSPFG